MYHVTFETPIGPLYLASDGNSIQQLQFAEQSLPAPRWCPLLHQAVAQLQDYFQGRRTTFDLPLHPQGTAFQQSVWRALTEVPFGSLASYADIARAIENPKGVRAVGMANRRNPIAILIPCHRIIGSDGSLTGYAGGLEKKAWLLKHEGWSPK